MLSRETYFVFGQIRPSDADRACPVAVLAVSDRFSRSEVVDVNHLARVDSYYGMNLPEGDYRLLVVSDGNSDGVYDEHEIVGMRTLSLHPASVPDKVLGGYDIDLAAAQGRTDDVFRIAVVNADRPADSIFYPRGTLRTLDDPIFSGLFTCHYQRRIHSLRSGPGWRGSTR